MNTSYDDAWRNATRPGVVAIGLCLVCKSMRRLVMLHTWLTTKGKLCGACRECLPTINTRRS